MRSFVRNEREGTSELNQTSFLEGANSLRASCSSRRRSSTSQSYSPPKGCWRISCSRREEERELATRSDWWARTSLVSLSCESDSRLWWSEGSLRLRILPFPCRA